MKKEEKIELLLKLHCEGCKGTLWGCRGCEFEEQIAEIINKK